MRLKLPQIQLNNACTHDVWATGAARSSSAGSWSGTWPIAPLVKTPLVKTPHIYSCPSAKLLGRWTGQLIT